MTLLIVGLVLFLGTHSVRVFADDWRTRQVRRLGEPAWKGLYTAVSLAGFALLVWGYSRARLEPTVLWASPLWVRHVAGLLMVPALILLVAAFVPGNAIRARLGHPMLLGTKVWALAHLLANNTLADLLLFGGFLVWAVLCFRAARARDRAASLVRAPGRAGPTIASVVAGLALWAALAFWAHAMLFGVRPFG
ncbi:MAG: NnrU family protein [Rubrivivax sp.]